MAKRLSNLAGDGLIDGLQYLLVDGKSPWCRFKLKDGAKLPPERPLPVRVYPNEDDRDAYYDLELDDIGPVTASEELLGLRVSSITTVWV